MSKENSIKLKGEIISLEKSVNSCVSLLNDGDKQILSSMDDTVGRSASESIKFIKSEVDYNFEKSIKASKNAADDLIKGYTLLKTMADEAEHLYRQAEQMKADLGTI